MIAFLRSTLTTAAVLLSNAAGVACGLGLYLSLTPDRDVATLLAGTAGTVFALIAGAGVPLLYSVADRSIVYWTDEYFHVRRQDAGERAVKALEVHLRALGVVVLAAVYLLLAVGLAVTVAYTESITGTWQRALLATAAGLTAAGLLLTLAFLLHAARIGEIQGLQEMFKLPPDPPAGPSLDQIDALLGPAVPHFAHQVRARIRHMIDRLPADDSVRRYGEETIEYLERLASMSSQAAEGMHEPRTPPDVTSAPDAPTAPPAP